MMMSTDTQVIQSDASLRGSLSVGRHTHTKKCGILHTGFKILRYRYSNE